VTIPHALDRRAPGVVHGAASRFEIDRCGLGEIDGHFGGLELVAFLDHRPGFRKLSAQLVRARIGAGRSFAPAAQEAEHCEPAEQPGERVLHCGDATLAAFLPRHRASFPEWRQPVRPIQTKGREVSGTVVAYEILLMLDPDLPEGRQEEIIKRARELVEKANGTWVRHDVWGRRRLAYEIAHKGEGSYHLLNFDADPETLAELSRVLRITDGVMRHLAVRRVEGTAGAPPPPEPEPVSRSVPEPAYAEANTSSEEE
jgi:small subunit ribosomal protein S6